MTTTVNPFLIRKPQGAKSRFATDKELAGFLNGVDRYYTTKELRALLIKRFGEKRVPSLSALHRYLQKITRGSVKPIHKGVDGLSYSQRC